MKVIAKCNGIKTEHEFQPPDPDRKDRSFGMGFDGTVLVHPPEIRVDPVDADCIISSVETRKCMEDMSQAAWVHISTGPLFKHFADILFKDYPIVMPETVKELVDDYDFGVIHGVGLIILLTESRFEGKKKVFLRTPEDHMHPGIQRLLMSCIIEIQKLPCGCAPMQVSTGGLFT